jgi:hypothetical protein
MVDPNTNGDEPRLVLTGGGSGARVVLAEVDAPGSLHYLLEAEGFHVVGCAGDDEELGRVLGQGVRPDVIVLDADVVASSSVVARELAPEAHLIAIWPEAVQPPPGGERISPRQVYEELGPAIRRHMDRRSVAVPVIALPAEEPAMAAVMAGVGVAAGAGVVSKSAASSGVFTRAASRMSVLSVTLITAILLTMGVSFALGGFRSSPTGGPPRLLAPGFTDPGAPAGAADPLTGRVPTGVGNGPSGTKPSKNGTDGPSDHHNASGGFGGIVVTTGTGGSGDTTGDQGTGDTTGDQGTGDPGTGQGDQGGGQGDQGGGQDDQGGGQGDQGGGSGGHGNGDGQHGGGGQGDHGGDDQGEDDQGGDDQGENDQGDNQHGDQNTQGDPAPHGDGHGAHSDDQDQDAQG